MPYLTGVRDARRAFGRRERKVVKVSDLAVLVGCSSSHLVNVEKGNRPASPELLDLLAEVLGVSPESFNPRSKAELSVPDEPPPQPQPAPKPPPRRKEKAPRPKRDESLSGAA
jgi:transcriptional regulator with XRE-family HTH domain